MHSDRRPSRSLRRPAATGLDGEGDPSTRETLDELVVAASRRLRHAWSDGLAPWGLSPHQSRALRVVSSGGPLRLGDLAERLRIAPRSATEVVDGLVEQGLLEREADPGDRRATIVRLTADGQRVSDEVLAARTSGAEEVFAGLSEADRATLARILRRVLATGGATPDS